MKRRLTKHSFAEQMFRHGFFYEQIPPCFSSAAFADHAAELLKSLNQDDLFVTFPTDISLYKGPTTRRTISIPNPASFAASVLLMRDNWSCIKKLAESENSHSPITFILSYDDPAGETSSEFINSESMRESENARSSFVGNLKDRIIASQDGRCRLRIDLSRFYSSIYTHSLTWAVCGKREAKQMYADGSTRNADYNLADRLDKYVRSQKGKETKGILTGPYTSRIFSEMLLAGIDRLLRDAAARGGYVFRRYVDDYCFYFNSEYEAQAALIEIEGILESFGLAINSEKTHIDPFPFEVLSDLNVQLGEALKAGGVFGLLNACARLQSTGEKGAYKYALKMLRSRQLPERDDPSLIMAQLFNISVNDPKCVRYIVSFLAGNGDRFATSKLQKALNQKTQEAIEANLDQEALNFLFMAKALGLKLHWSVVVETLDRGCDLSRIIALDYAKHKRALVIDASHHTAEIAEAIEVLGAKLAGSSLDGEHWLLLHECCFHGLMDVQVLPGKTDDFFETLNALGISFYQAIGADCSCDGA